MPELAKLAFAFCFLVIIIFVYIYTYWKRKGVPFFWPIIPVGNALPLVLGKMGIAEHGALMYQKLKSLKKGFGGYFVGHFPIFQPTDPHLIKCILVKDSQYFSSRGFYYDIEVDPLSSHLVSLSGPSWKKLHSNITPFFTSAKLKTTFHKLLECSKELEGVLEEPAQCNESVDIVDILSRLVADNIATCIYGVQCNSLQDPNTKFYQYGQKIIDSIFHSVIWNFLAICFPSLFLILKLPITNSNARSYMLEFLAEILNYRKNHSTNNGDFIDSFIKLNSKVNNSYDKDENLTFNEFSALAFTFYIAGYVSTYITMSYCLLELSANSKIQDELRKEINRVLENHDGNITYEALIQMKYLDKILYEVLRKYPPTPVLIRECQKDYRIPSSDVVIQKGTSCWMFIWGMHMDPEYYPDPDKFDPERFSKEEEAKRHPFTYLPFGAGPRYCIGQRLSILQVKLAVVQLIKQFEFSLDSKTKLPLQFYQKTILLVPKDKIWLRVKRC